MKGLSNLYHLGMPAMGCFSPESSLGFQPNKGLKSTNSGPQLYGDHNHRNPVSIRVHLKPDLHPQAHDQGTVKTVSGWLDVLDVRPEI